MFSRRWGNAVVQQSSGGYVKISWLHAAAFLILAPVPASGAEGIVFTDHQQSSPQAASNESADDYAAAASLTPAPAWSGDFGTRSQVTGDWCGRRDALAASGLTFYGDLTQYYQGVAAGGNEQQFKYGWRADYLIDLDSQKMGLWDGGHLDLRAESRLGQDTNRIDGTVALSNFAMALPIPVPSVTALTGVQYTHTVSDGLSVFAGKLNLLDGTPAAYTRGLRLNYFYNAAMQSNLSRVFLIPSTLGCGFTVRDEAEPVFNFFLLDTHYTPTTTGFPTLFSNGVLGFGEYRQRTNWFGLPGHSAIGFLYSNATRGSLDSNPYVSLPISPGVTLPPIVTKSSAWTVTYRFDQVLYADPDDPTRRWSLNGDYGITDGNPNRNHWFANLSLVGNSPLEGRENDTIGVGYYHLGLSALPLLEQLGLSAENGVELFYNAAITPWFHVTPDLQILDPSQRQNAMAILVGVRARISF
ncbi:MAG: carbohydrate porin [Pirellulaceae bacterium]